MRKVIIIFSLFIFSSPLFAGPKISFISGDVSLYHTDAWVKASTSTVLSLKDKIKTASNSRAIIVLDNLTQVWVNENSELSVASLGQESFFDLLAGKIRAKVKLNANEKFRVKTPVSVASVRGTDFILTFEGILAVLEGKVEFSDAFFKQVVEVLKDQFGSLDDQGKMKDPKNMTPEEKAKLEEEWKLFIEYTKAKTEQAEASDKEAENLRKEIYKIISEVKNDIRLTRELMNEIKESDFSAGRTLRDVHGNLVRVEQHLIRPDSNTLQVLNLTKRTEYRYVDHGGMGVTYNGPVGSRLDVMDCTMKMNMPLPEQLSEWPGYIASKGDDIHPSRVSVKFTNVVDTIEMKGQWQNKGYVTQEGKTLEEDGLVFTHYVNNWQVDDSYKAEDQDAVRKNNTKQDGHDAGYLWEWNISRDQKIIDPNNSSNFKYINFYEESYCINNSGNIMSLNSFANSSENPFTLLKQIAGEQIVFCRERNGNDFLKKGNIDLVYIPDVIVAVALQIATSADSFRSSESNNP
ncbi:MAG: FecR family protein [Elusimicrobia bacterium]|nr:FecR family protein [Elusimicrobiota bacterium]